jgi:RND family efflux transporter MFP subunit
MSDSNRSNLWLPLLAIIGLLLSVAWMAGAFSTKLAPGLTPEAKVSDAGSVPVERVSLPLLEPVPATIRAKQTSVISSRILARIDKIMVHAGDEVKQGQLLIRLEQTGLKARVSQTRTQINSVSARLIEAEKTLTRTKELSQRGVVAKAALDAAQANYDSLRANLANAKQALNEAQSTLAFADIHSPMDGRIVDRFAEPGDTAQPGARLLSIYNPLSMRVEANVREQLALSLLPHQKLEVYVPAVHKQFDTELAELVPAGNPGSRNFLVKTRLVAHQGLLPGTYARMLVPAGSQTVLVIPADRVASVGQLNVVWVFHDGLVDRRFIRLGKKLDGGKVEVISGLSAGEKIMPVPKP